MKEPKQVILVRKDLKMGAGKLAAQVAHASICALLDRVQDCFIPELGGPGFFTRYGVSREEKEWLEGSQTKVVLWVNDKAQLLNYHQQAVEKKLTSSLIQDEGRTELQGKNYTTVAIGPANPDLIDELTGDLKLCRIWGENNEEKTRSHSIDPSKPYGLCKSD